MVILKRNMNLKILLGTIYFCVYINFGYASTLSGTPHSSSHGVFKVFNAGNEINNDRYIEDILTSPDHLVQKRDTGLSKPVDSKQRNITTKVNQLSDSHQQLMVHWAGEGSDVVICLARDPVTKPGDPTRPSAVYISYDYGDTFQNKTNHFSFSSQQTDEIIFASIDKFYNHPKFITHVVFLDKDNKVIFTTSNSGKSFQQYALPFKPVEISFHPEDPAMFLIHDEKLALWTTNDFGQSFARLQEFVKVFYWVTEEGSAEQYLLIQRAEPTTSSVIAVTGLLPEQDQNLSLVIGDVVDCWVKGEFIFVTRKDPKLPLNLDLLVSHKRGEFKKALFQSELHRQAYHIVDTDSMRIMVAVSHSEYTANLYVSEMLTSKGDIRFSISLERVFCYFQHKMWTDSWLSDLADSTFADVHKVEGMKGIYIASQVLDNVGINPGVEHLRSVITFDWGGEWRPITAPRYSADHQPIYCTVANNCSLHLSQKFAQMYPVTRAAPILSSKSAPGIILATGVLGSSLKGHVGLYMSRDAGLTWMQILQEYYLFNFGDHGGVVVAVKYFKSNGETNMMKYSTDEGENWQDHTFTDEDLRVYGLMTEPGENTTVFTMFGSARSHHQWLIVKVDLRNAFSYNCTPDDYKFWSPSSGQGAGGDEGVKMSCVLGVKETYERRVPHSNCYNGRDYDRPIKMEICPCEAEDFECDFGFERVVGSSQCVRNKSLEEDPYAVPQWCKPGVYYNRTKGYLKIQGDACVTGRESHFLPDNLPCPYDERKEFLLLAQKDRIVRFDLVSLQLEELPVRGLQNVIAVDFDIHNNCVYWADIITDTIARQCLGVNNSGSAEILVERDLSSVEGMAFDWMSNMLYFVDGIKARIQVIRTDVSHGGRMRRTVLGPDVLKKPRGIAVHPAQGYMYWTDWSASEPCVARAALDGSAVKRLFTSPVVEWPNGITVDFIAERIYFVDARQDFIGSADLNGKDFKKIIQNKNEVSHPFAVAVFKDQMYWDDWKQNGLYSADKDHGIGIQAIETNLPGLMDLKVYAHSLQEGTNSCRSSKCSHLCFALPGNKTLCECPDAMERQTNGDCFCTGGVKPNANDTCPEDQNKKCSPDHFKCNNDLCIPKLWACDGDNDCGDFSDEANCGTRTCQPTQFRCVNSGKCISSEWRCDYDKDCDDGSDEVNCTYIACQRGQFKCANNRCISQRWVCDMEDDCRDGSDEANCTSTTQPTTCGSGYFMCNSPRSCIPRSWRCDGEKDCQDNSDEVQCDNNTCESWQFQCANKRCIFKAWQCDGDHDCGNGDLSDEENCPEPTKSPVIPTRPQLPTNTCSEWMFKCSNQKCIPYWWKCDGVNDCGDSSDEIACGPITGPSTYVTPPTPPMTPGVCRRNQFRCLSGECIQESWVCDGIQDCGDQGEDEAHCKGSNMCDLKEQFKCRQDGSCIPVRQLCDGINQCPDFSDEMSCSSSAAPAPVGPNCNLGMFSCDNNRCLPLVLMCNGHTDCYDESDERDCNSTSKIYQVMRFGVEENATNSTSLMLFWWLPTLSDSAFEYLPAHKVANSPNSPWINGSWIHDSSYQFLNLRPYTLYNLTVYVRNTKTKEIYPPGKFFTATTAEGDPSAPWNVTVRQTSTHQVQVAWASPHEPNGPLTSFSVCMTPPIPPLCKTVHGSKTETFIDSVFNAQSDYSFWVKSKNSRHESNSSAVAVLKFDESSYLDLISDLRVESHSADSVKLVWSPVKNAERYHVIPKGVITSNKLYPKLPTLEVTTNSASITNLAPGTDYTIEVIPYNKHFEGVPSSVFTKTDGTPLPQIMDLHVDVLRSQGTSFKVGWTAPQDSRKATWQYGIYYGHTVKDLLSKEAAVKTVNTSFTLHDLAACQSYVVSVGLVGPMGLGPLSLPFSAMTRYNVSAAPKGLRVLPDPHNTTAMSVTWSASCPFLNQAVQYEISVTEMNLGLSASYTLAPSLELDLQHTFFIEFGGRYKVCVSTALPNSVAGPCQEYYAPPLPPPHQLQVLEATNGSFIIYWRQDTFPSDLPSDQYHYVVLVSPGNTLNVSTAQQLKTQSAPYIFSPPDDESIYTYAVVMETNAGYRSLPSEAVSTAALKGSWSEMLQRRSLLSLALPTLLVVLVVCCLLATALGLVSVRHRRLQNTFSNFTNSHFSTRSGTATFGAVTDDLEDEDSPVIRGFSDDEPLVIA